MIVYIFKLNLSLILLYGFYKVMMTSDTFFGYRRMALIAIPLLSLAVPLIDLHPLIEQNTTAVSIATTYAEYMLPMVWVSDSPSTFTWMDVLTSVYWLGVAFFGLRFLFQLMSILYQACITRSDEIEGVKIRRMNRQQSPFSFFSWIFVYPEALSAEKLHVILEHEKAHACQQHSIDVIVSELFTVFNWFNPFCYLLKKEIRLNLEYLADKVVLDRGNARKPYQYHLLDLTDNTARCLLTNNFNVLLLKKRIKMMNINRTNESRKAKYLLFLPLTAALLAVSNIEMIARTISQKTAKSPSQPIEVAKDSRQHLSEKTNVIQKQEPQKKSSKNNKVFDIVDQMPEFPGGQNALMKYMADNIKYPSTAVKANIEGRVIMQFVIEKNGSVSNVHVVKSAHKTLDAEALRVIKAMPKWNPGRHAGKLVRVKYNIPVIFSLSKKQQRKSS